MNVHHDQKAFDAATEENALARLPSFDAIARRLASELPNHLNLKERHARRYVIERLDEAAYGHRIRRASGVLAIKDDGELVVDLGDGGVAFKVTDEERAAVAAEVKAAKATPGRWPCSIPATVMEAEHKCKSLRAEARARGEDEPMLFVFRDETGENALFVQQRVFFETGEKKTDLPWTLWNDGIWRMCEPSEGLLPLYGLDHLPLLYLPAHIGMHGSFERAKGNGGEGDVKATAVMIHEGAKTADFVRRMLTSNLDPEAKEWHRRHPWAAELRSYAHIGWPGGAPNSHRVDWLPIKKLAEDVRVVLVTDHDQPGIDAATRVSGILMRPLEVVVFSDEFRPSFDLADEWPQRPEWTAGGRYRGPTIADLSRSGTWATEEVKGGGRGRPAHRVRDQFAREWITVTEPAVLINRRRPERMLSEATFDGEVRPFSHVDGRLLSKKVSSKVETVAYLPGRKSGIVTHEGQRVFNTWREGRIRPATNYKPEDAEPLLDFMRHLIPIDEERNEVLRWVATLLARPDMRMQYGVLLVSEEQGVGKGTLGEKILAPLVGNENVSFPDETMIESSFNYWAAHKRLAVVHEIYAGHSRRLYDKLKSLITDGRITVSRKFMAEYVIDNHLHVFACSNSLNALAIDDKDRRWLVPRVTEDRRDKEYWRELNRRLDEENGLAIVRRWADEFLKVNEPVRPGDRPMMTDAKRDVIEAGRTEGERMASRIAELAIEFSDLVLRLDEVRWLVAYKRSRNVECTESELRLKKAMIAAGMHEPPKGADGRRRMKIGGVYHNVVATFAFDHTDTWEKIKEYHIRPQDLEEWDIHPGYARKRERR